MRGWMGGLLVLVLNGHVLAEPIAFPEGYRAWHHVKSMTLHEGHALEVPFKGIHHVYANDAALDGVQGREWSDGSVLVFDLLESVEHDRASVEGSRVLLGVMIRDEKRFSATGGWGFEAWRGDRRDERLVEDGGQSCYACHLARKDSDYVFSRWRP